MSLATKYRPTTFDQVVEQSNVITILQQQLETEKIKHCYIFKGQSGNGKTTIARIFANMINNGQGSPIEIDAASNNSVDGIRDIISEASVRALGSKYKVYILDEAHALSNSSWQALLKLVEEPPKYTVFIFCTTNASKIPATILNRCQIFNFSKISTSSLVKRLKYVCDQEQIKYQLDALQMIATFAEGSMRQSLTYLEKCTDFGSTITAEVVHQCLGTYGYDVLFDMLNGLIDHNQKVILQIIDQLDNDGSDLSLFVEQLISFVLDVTKYSIFKDYSLINIPEDQSAQMNNVLNLDVDSVPKYYNQLVNKLLAVKLAIKGDSNIKTTIQIMLTNL